MKTCTLEFSRKIFEKRIHDADIEMVGCQSQINSLVNSSEPIADALPKRPRLVFNTTGNNYRGYSFVGEQAVRTNQPSNESLVNESVGSPRRKINILFFASCPSNSENPSESFSHLSLDEEARSIR